MRLVLDPVQEAAHGGWLRQTVGAYEWWYFDALSDDGEWALTCIWFLGNPFSAYYRQSALGQPPSPYRQNAFFFSLYRHGKLHAYHFTRFPESQLTVGEKIPLELHFGPNFLSMLDDGKWRLALSDENANGRQMQAALTFTGPPLAVAAAELTPLDGDHSWLPVAPFCRVGGQIELREAHNSGSELVRFSGTGYHDHNWGRLPFDAAIRDWYWARASLSEGKSVILYHVQPHRGAAVSHLLLFDQGHLIRHNDHAAVIAARPTLNGFGTRYYSQLTAKGQEWEVKFQFEKRLDSAPFYLRALCTATVRQEGHLEIGQGIGEYLRPQLMSSRLAASAMKARIVER